MSPYTQGQPPKDDLPQEVKDYYKSERRQKTGVAWLLAIGTLILTLLVAAALFFAGSWLWNTLTNDDQPSDDTSQTATESAESQPPADQGAQQDSTAGVTGSDYTTSSQTNSDTSVSTGSDGGTTAGSTAATSSSSTTIPSTGDSTVEPDTLVNTGPGVE